MNEITSTGSKAIQAAAHHENVARLRSYLDQLPQSDYGIRDIFLPGIYMREMTIPAGSILVGAVHKTKHAVIVSGGRIAVDSGAGVVEMAAPLTFASEAGAERVGIAMEDTVFTTVHPNPTNSTDVAWLTEQLTHSKLEELVGGSKNVQLQNQRNRELE